MGVSSRFFAHMRYVPKPHGMPIFVCDFMLIQTEPDKEIFSRVAQSVTCLATDACPTADPGVASSIPVRSHTFVAIDHEIISTSFSSLQEGLLSVTSESMYTNYWLTACSSLPRKKCG